MEISVDRNDEYELVFYLRDSEQNAESPGSVLMRIPAVSGTGLLTYFLKLPKSLIHQPIAYLEVTP